MYQEHLEQAIALFKLFYYAKDWKTFYKTAVWAREYINERMFVYAFSVAVLHRPDTQGIVLPPIYEITPHLFFNQEVINEASILKQTFNERNINALNNDRQFDGITVYSNYSGWYLNLHPEQSMSYFMEDIELNAQYYNVHLWMPFWMDSKEFKQLETHPRGQIYLYQIYQRLARLYMERLSNDYGEVHEIDFDSPVEVHYHPSLVYPNGLPFPSRPKFAELAPYYRTNGEKWTNPEYSHSLAFVKDYAGRISDAADRGFALAVSIL